MLDAAEHGAKFIDVYSNETFTVRNLRPARHGGWLLVMVDGWGQMVNRPMDVVRMYVREGTWRQVA